MLKRKQGPKFTNGGLILQYEVVNSNNLLANKYLCSPARIVNSEMETETNDIPAAKKMLSCASSCPHAMMPVKVLCELVSILHGQAVYFITLFDSFLTADCVNQL